MALSGDWMNLYIDGNDWLDKPHMPFWITAFSFKLFGISSFTYKLPAFICWLTGLYFLFRLARLLYDRETAFVTVIIYASALHVVLSNFDVRAEPYLTTFIICAIYFLAKMFQGNSIKWVVLAAFAIAAAIMTKGIFVLITIGGGFLFYIISIRGFRLLLNYRWLLLIILTIILTIPELYSLYNQFDLHPEKVVFGKTNVSGIKFFLWDSQFGRFFNTGPIKGHGDYWFFLHTTLWAFLPWSLILIASIWNLFRKRTVNKMVYIISGSALLTFVMFSLSRFQLPHYIVILCPHFALISGRYLTNLRSIKTIRILKMIQAGLLIILPVILTALYYYSGLMNSVMAWIPVTVIAWVAVVVFRSNSIKSILARGVFFTTALFYYMNIYFYPSLLPYQSGIPAAKFFNKIAPASQPYLYMNNSWSFRFYSRIQPVQINNDSLRKYKTDSLYAFVKQPDLKHLDSSGYTYTVVNTFNYFRVSMLTSRFLNKNTRDNTLAKTMLIKIYKRDDQNK